MSENVRTTVYFDAALHKALQFKAVAENTSVSDLVNYCVRELLAEDAEDLAAIHNRVHEPSVSYETALEELKKSGKI